MNRYRISQVSGLLGGFFFFFFFCFWGFFFFFFLVWVVFFFFFVGGFGGVFWGCCFGLFLFSFFPHLEKMFCFLVNSNFLPLWSKVLVCYLVDSWLCVQTSFFFYAVCTLPCPIANHPFPPPLSPKYSINPGGRKVYILVKSHRHHNSLPPKLLFPN